MTQYVNVYRLPDGSQFCGGRIWKTRKACERGRSRHFRRIAVLRVTPKQGDLR